MRTVVLASLRHQARRYVAAGLAILIAVAFVVAVNGLSGAAREGAREQVSQELLGADVVLTGDLSAPDLARRVGSVPGVDGVAANRVAYTDVRLAAQAQTRAVGSVAAADDLRWQRPSSGRLPERPDEALLSSDATDGGRVGIGDRVTVRLEGRDRRFAVTGLVPASSGPNGADVYVGERVLAGTGDAFATSVVVHASGDTGQVLGRLTDDLGGSVQVRSRAEHVAEQQRAATQGVDVLQNVVLAFALLAAFVGVLVIANTFTMLLAHRSRDFALLRCVGTGRRQLVRGVVIEAGVLALVAAGLGALTGWGLAVAAAALLRTSLDGIAFGGVALGPLGVLVPVAAAVGVTVLASWLPARRVSRLSPLAALAPDAAAAPVRGTGRARTAVAVLVLAIGASGLALGTRAPSLPVAMLGGMVSFIGVLLLGPVLVPALVRAAGVVIARGGVPGRLAVLNATRNPRRTAATSAALLVGVTLVTTVVVGTASVKADLGRTLDAAEPVDLSLTSTSEPVQPDVADRVRGTEGVAAAVVLDGARVQVGSQELTALGVGRAARTVAHDAALPELRPGTAIVPWDVLESTGSVEGDAVEVTGPGGRTVRLTAVPSGSTGGAVLMVPRDLRAVGGGASVASAVWARATTDADAATTSADVAEVADAAGLEPSGGLAERAQVLRVLDVVLAVTIGLLGVSVAIALVGVANTLGLSVLERTRENALLRALGLGRRGLRRTLATEALLMALVSAVLGTVLGVVYAWCGVRVMSEGILNGLVVPWGQVAAVLLVAAAAGLLASLLPARRAARTAPAAGLVAD